jgi:hypothetical protein
MKEFTFDGQRADESVEEAVKNHPFILFLPGLKSMLFLVIPIAVLLFWGATSVFTFTAFIAVLVAFAVFSKSYYEYSASVLIVTNQRVIYLDQEGFFKRRIIETNLDKIQDVASDTSGVLRTTLDYGDLIIRTAGAGKGSEIIVKNIASPYQIQQAITKRI